MTESKHPKPGHEDGSLPAEQLAAQAQAIAIANENEELLQPQRPETPLMAYTGPQNESERVNASSANTLPQKSSSGWSPSHTDSFLSSSDIDGDSIPPPAYSERFDHVNLSQGGFQTSAKLQDDGRINIDIKGDSPFVSNLLAPALRRSLLHDAKADGGDLPPGYIPPSLGGDAEGPPPPPMNVVIHVVGSRGDVQPFVALGKVLKEKYGHRVRLATHGVFKDFVTENGLEFFCIGGNPAELMAFMVKNPGLMPGTDALKNGDVRKRRKGMYEIIQGCWRSCYEAGDGVGIPSADSNSSENFEDGQRPFVADAIIANPPSFAHIHCAEKLAIPLHMMFTMPWSPTQAFPHPLANIQNSSTDVSLTNFLSYVLVELMTWQGLGDIINRFREKHLKLEPLSSMWAPALASRLRIPFTYCWSPSLIPKPKDWGNHVSVSGFYFLSLASNYQPAADLQNFLDAGPPPVYIGFGSIVVDDPAEMTRLIFDAVKLSGQRALVSKGWGGFGSEGLEVPENIFMLGNIPHDWLFRRVSCVVHHGGAGTTAAGIALGCPTVVVPFFGDQPFWGAMVARAGAGPTPIPSKQLTAEKLADAIKEALTETSKERAKELALSIADEEGCEVGAKSFHQAIDMDNMRCSIAPSRVAVWRLKRTNIRLSALAASVLGQEGRIDFAELRLHRPKECDAEESPYEPLGGAASALIGTAGSMMMGLADIPVDVFKAMSKKSAEPDPSPEQEQTKETNPENSTKNVEELDDAEKESLDPSGPHASNSSRVGLQPPKSPNRSQTSRPKSPVSPGKSGLTMESALDTTRGIGRFTEAGLKSPMDFTLALAKGFRNAPKLYGDQVRPATRVTGIQSGLKASAKEFGYGMFDGITGLVTQPMEGAKKEGVPGLIKGFGRGLGGIFFKPGAAFWGIPAYTFQGIYKEIKKSAGSNLQNYIIAARTAQGFEDWASSTIEERKDILTRWGAMQEEVERQKKNRHVDMFKRNPQQKATKEPYPVDSHIPELIPNQPSSDTAADSAQSRAAFRSAIDSGQSTYDEAIRQSVAQTSIGNAEEDAMIERAIRASLAELEQQPRQTEDEEAMARAIRESLHQAQGKPGFTSTEPWVAGHGYSQGQGGEDEQLRRALLASQEQTKEQSEEDAELARAVYESRRSHDEQKKALEEEEAVIERVKQQTLGRIEER